MTTDIVGRLRTELLERGADLTARDETIRRMSVEAKVLRAENDRLRAEVERMQTALDAIYNHNEAARAAVIQHYGLWHNTALKEHTNGR